MRRIVHGLLFRALGRLYPGVMLTLTLLLGHVVVLGGVALLLVYVDLDGGQFGRIVAVTQGLVLLENVASWVVVRRLLRPARPWLRGDRSPAAATAAWRAFASLPLRYVRHLRGLPVALNVLPVAAYIGWELEGRFAVTTFLVLSAGAAIVLAYGVFLRFFLFEQILRPVVAAAWRDVPDGADLGRVSVPLKWRLLVALPVMNVVTGVVAAGLAGDGDGVDALGLGVVVAIAIAFTISLELTLLLLASVLEPLRELRRGTEAVARGEYDVRVAVMGSDEPGRLAGAFNTMVRGLQERRRLHEAFGAFVDPVLAERVLHDGHALAGEEVEVTVLFVDIEGFTAFAERSGAAEVVAELNRFYEAVVPVLVRHGGHANKFVGDGLLGVFGAPDRLADHADRAMAAACEIVPEVEDRLAGRLRIGIGVNSGPVVAGTVGGGGRVEFGVIGDVVNTAARVQEATRVTGDALLLTEQTRCLLERDHGPLEERPTVPLKGKSERVRIHAALAARHGARRAERPAEARTP